MIDSFEEYKNYYEKWGKCIDQFFPPKNPISERELKNRFEKYIKKSPSKKSFKKDERWIQVREVVIARDKGECQLLNSLPFEEKQELMKNSYGLWRVVDPAHILNKSTYSSLYYDPDDIVCLNRYSHGNLDTLHHPITGDKITVEEEEMWWRFIVGNERYDRLLEKGLLEKTTR